MRSEEAITNGSGNLPFLDVGFLGGGGVLRIMFWVAGWLDCVCFYTGKRK